MTEERLHYRHAVSPYLGEKLRGVVKATYLRGKPVFAEGQIPRRAPSAGSTGANSAEHGLAAIANQA